MRRSTAETLVAAFLLVSSSTLALAQAEQKQTMSSAWNALKSSWLGDKFRVQCYDSRYEIEKPMLGSITIKWLDKEGNWYALGVTNIADEAIAFQGLGIQSAGAAGAFDTSDPSISEMIKASKYPAHSASEVSVVAAEDVFVPFKYTMNMMNQTVSGKNEIGFKAQVRLWGNDEKLPPFEVKPLSVEKKSDCQISP